MGFQDEIAQIQMEKAKKFQEQSFVGSNREKCGAYIDAICDAIRRRIKSAAREGAVRYQTYRTYRVKADGETELRSEEKTSPHYTATWLARCEIDFSKKTFFYDAQEMTFYINEVSTLFYILDEVELRLSLDGIFPVEFKETEKDLDYLFVHLLKYENICVKSHLCRPDNCDSLKKASADYQRGLGRGQLSAAIGSGFAYFIPEQKTTERK